MEKINSINPEIAQKFSDNYNLFRIAFAGYNAAFAQGLGDCWLNFLIAILSKEDTENNITKLLNIFEKLHACDMLSNFINLYFNKNRAQNTQDLLQIIFAELNNPNTIAFLQIFATKRKELEAFDLTVWQDPKNFENLITIFDQQFIQFFTHPELILMFTNSESNNLLKLAAQSTMEKFVTVFDSSIKNLKSSTLYPDTGTNPLQVINFKKMLQAYLNVFDKWLILLPEDCICKNNEAPRVETIQEALNNTSNNNYELTASPEFNVNNCIWGGCSVDWDFKHAEDIFMLIHQNLLSILGMLTKHYYFNINEAKKLIFPELFEKLNEKILEIEFNEDSASLINIFFDNNKIYSRYNLPLNMHSLILELTYDMQTKTTELAINFVGSAEGPERWYKISALALTYSIIRENIEDLKIFDSGSSGTTLIYRFTNESDLSHIVKNIQEFAKITFNYIEGEETIFSPENITDLYNLTDKLIYLSPNNWQISKFIIKLFEKNSVTGLELFVKAQQICSSEVLMPLYSLLVSLDYQEYFLPAFDLAIKYIIQSKKNYIYEDKALNVAKEILEELAKRPECQVIIRKHADLFLLKHFSLAKKGNGLLLYSYLIDGNYEPAYERALSIAEQEVMEYAHTQKYNEYEDAILELFNSLIYKNIGINKILSIIKQLMQINFDTYKITNAKRIAINLCIFLLENIDDHDVNRPQINQLSLNVAYTILNKTFSTQLTKENSSKMHTFKRLIQLLNVLIQNNIGINEITIFIRFSYNSQLENLKKALVMQLCSVFVENGPIKYLDFVYQILVSGINTNIPIVQENSLNALNELVKRTPKYRSEITRIASKLIQSKSTMVFINAQKILRTIRKINIKPE
ncbi:hypothetical protein K9M16_01185 [Candidatus Babeliales bacterium]|nr:hypothetical protein [Candidatus Babeliales bacterium]